MLSMKQLPGNGNWNLTLCRAECLGKTQRLTATAASLWWDILPGKRHIQKQSFQNKFLSGQEQKAPKAWITWVKQIAGNKNLLKLATAESIRKSKSSYLQAERAVGTGSSDRLLTTARKSWQLKHPQPQEGCKWQRENNWEKHIN